MDFFDEMKMIASQPVGREIVWDLFRIQYKDILNTFGTSDPRAGELLVYISSTFESDIMLNEVNPALFCRMYAASFNFCMNGVRRNVLEMIDFLYEQRA